jgi:hypothetical protein
MHKLGPLLDSLSCTVALHTNENEGRKFKENGVGGRVSFGISDNEPFGARDNLHGTGLVRMAANKNLIRFYNSTGELFTIKPDVFDPKYFKPKTNGN